MSRQEYLKKWRLEHKEQLRDYHKAYNKDYFKDNQEDIQRQRCNSQKTQQSRRVYNATEISCVCGRKMQQGNIYRHRLTCETSKAWKGTEDIKYMKGLAAKKAIELNENRKALFSRVLVELISRRGPKN